MASCGATAGRDHARWSSLADLGRASTGCQAVAEHRAHLALARMAPVLHTCQPPCRISDPVGARVRPDLECVHNGQLLPEHEDFSHGR